MYLEAVCHDNIRRQIAPCREMLITPNFNTNLAQYWLSFDLSAGVLWELLLSTWYGYEGVLHDKESKSIDLWTPDSSGDDYIDRLAKDPVRSLRRYLAFGKTTRINQLREEHHDLAVMLYHARAIQQHNRSIKLDSTSTR